VLCWSGGVVHVDILCVIQVGSLVVGITYTCGHWRQTYWHTRMADRYDINDISQLSFVSILCELFTCLYELPSRSISWVKLLLVARSCCFPWANASSFLLWNHFVYCQLSFVLTSRPCLIPKIIRLVYSCLCIFPSSAFSQRGWGSGR